jgi:hypothetical protein
LFFITATAAAGGVDTDAVTDSGSGDDDEDDTGPLFTKPTITKTVTAPQRMPDTTDFAFHECTTC